MMKKIFTLISLIFAIVSIMGCAAAVTDTAATTATTQTQSIEGTWVAATGITGRTKIVTTATNYTISASTDSGSTYGAALDAGTYTYNPTTKTLTTASTMANDSMVRTSTGLTSSKLTFGQRSYKGGNAETLIGSWTCSETLTGSATDYVKTSTMTFNADNTFSASMTQTGSGATSWTMTGTVGSINLSTGTFVISGSSNPAGMANGTYYFALVDGVLSLTGTVGSAYLSDLFILQPVGTWVATTSATDRTKLVITATGDYTRTKSTNSGTSYSAYDTGTWSISALGNSMSMTLASSTLAYGTTVYTPIGLTSTNMVFGPYTGSGGSISTMIGTWITKETVTGSTSDDHVTTNTAIVTSTTESFTSVRTGNVPHSISGTADNTFYITGYSGYGILTNATGAITDGTYYLKFLDYVQTGTMSAGSTIFPDYYTKQ